VLVANHASYLDGIALFAALPAHFSFVAEREFLDQPGCAPLPQAVGRAVHGAIRRSTERRGCIPNGERGDRWYLDSVLSRGCFQAHGIWQLFVIAGSATRYVVILYYMLRFACFRT